jgi:tetratricopeptide (TPR) repeat protein
VRAATNDDFDALLADYQRASHEIHTNSAIGPSSTLEAFLARDRIAAAIAKSNEVVLDHHEQLSELDNALRQHAARRWHDFSDSLLSVRDLIQPPNQYWWWYLNHSNPSWAIGALFFLTLSVSLVADFSRRLLSSNPDAIGIAAIASQAMFTVFASSTFTSGGRLWLAALAKHFTPAVGRQEPLKFWIVLSFFCATLAIWAFAPPALARYYNRRGLDLMESHPALALQDFDRAQRLDPTLSEIHVDMAGTYLRNFEFESAIGEYEKALMLDIGNLTAFNNLAYALLLNGKSSTALSVMDSAFSGQASLQPKEIQGALYKNRAVAEYDLGFLQAAQADIQHSISLNPSNPSVYCTQAKIDTKLQHVTDALNAWATMLARPPAPHQPLMEPDCTRLAEEALHATH